MTIVKQSYKIHYTDNVNPVFKKKNTSYKTLNKFQKCTLFLKAHAFPLIYLAKIKYSIIPFQISNYLCPIHRTGIKKLLDIMAPFCELPYISVSWNAVAFFMWNNNVNKSDSYRSDVKQQWWRWEYAINDLKFGQKKYREIQLTESDWIYSPMPWPDETFRNLYIHKRNASCDKQICPLYPSLDADREYTQTVSTESFW